MELQDIIINKNNNLREALELLDKNGSGTLFVVNDLNKLIGVLTDGDVRRFLLKDVNLKVKVEKLMNREFTSLSIDTDNAKIIECLNDKIKYIPLLDENGVIVDYASINRLRRISICSPLLEGNELLYLTECVKTNWISSQGKYVRLFEKKFKDYHEGFEALAVSNGTVALHLALEALGVGEGDEVIVPDLTFAASINAVIYTGATPVLVDVEQDSFNLDVTKIEELITGKTKAIMPVHLYGQSCDMDAVAAIAKKHNLFIVEDCAEALGSLFKGRPVGVFGDAATFSFFGNKTITTGEGGMVLFKDSKIAHKASVLRDHGMSKEKRYWHDYVGFNYRLTNLQASVGVAQFERLEYFVQAKRNLAATYNETLNKYDFFQTPIEKEGTFNSYWLYTFLIKDNAPFSREDLMDYLSKKGIESRPVFYPLHIMPPYKTYGNKEHLQTSAMISRSGVSLPSSVNLSKLETKYICNSISDFILEL
jgi:perosamine synthetase